MINPECTFRPQLRQSSTRRSYDSTQSVVVIDTDNRIKEEEKDDSALDS